jgi:Prolipoprotein diacylglyceryl transferase
MIEAIAHGSVPADRLNRAFDRAVGLHIRIGSRMVHSWRVFSLAAFGAASLVWVALGLAGDLPVPALVLPPVLSLAVFSVHRRQVLRSGGPVRFVFHRHLLISAPAALSVLALLDALSWRVLDNAAPAVLVGLAVGRVGCLRAGCCVGRPAAVGPRYAWVGEGERRVPVQVLDAAACLVCAGAALALPATAGVATAAGFGGYFVARFFLDELRDERVQIGRWTEAQRLAIVVAGAAAATLALIALR